MPGLQHSVLSAACIRQKILFSFPGGLHRNIAVLGAQQPISSIILTPPRRFVCPECDVKRSDLW